MYFMSSVLALAGTRGSDAFVELLIFCRMAAADGARLVMQMTGRMVGADQKPLGLCGIEVEDAGFAMVDPEYCMKVFCHWFLPGGRLNVYVWVQGRGSTKLHGLKCCDDIGFAQLQPHDQSVVLAIDEHWNAGMRHDLHSLATQQETAKPPVAMRAHDNQIAALMSAVSMMAR